MRIACEEITGFFFGQSFEVFLEGRLLQLPLEHEFEIIGFRNLVDHGDDAVNDVALCGLAINHVPELRSEVLNYTP